MRLCRSTVTDRKKSIVASNMPILKDLFIMFDCGNRIVFTHESVLLVSAANYPCTGALFGGTSPNGPVWGQNHHFMCLWPETCPIFEFEDEK